MPAATYSPTHRRRACAAAPEKRAHAAHGNCVSWSLAYKTKPARFSLAGLKNNAGSDLLSHTPPPRVCGGARKESPCSAWELCVVVARVQNKTREVFSRGFEK